VFTVKRIILITQNAEFALNATQLNVKGEYMVSHFSSARNALAHLRNNPQHAAIVDFSVPDMPGADVVQAMRRMQPDIAILIAPDNRTVRRETEPLNIQAYIQIPLSLRQLIPALQTAIKTMHDALPDTVMAPAISPPRVEKDKTDEVPKPPMPRPHDQTQGQPPVAESKPETRSSEPPPPPELTQPAPPAVPPAVPEPKSPLPIFERLKAEEPPLPNFEQSATVRDLIDNLGDRDLGGRAGAPRSASPDMPPPPPLRDKQRSQIPAALILERATDDSTPLDGFSITQFMARLRDDLPEGEIKIMPLPSWLADAERYIREPDFLPEFLPEDLPEPPLTYTSSVTALHDAVDIEEEPDDWHTERMEPLVRSRPSEPDDVVELSPEFTGSQAEPQPQPQPEAEPEPEPEPKPEAARPPTVVMLEERRAAAAPPPEVMPQAAAATPEEAYFARIALALTQVSVDVAADSTLLARSGQLVARAGALLLEDIEELLPQISPDWMSNPGQGRVRFVHQESTGTDFMLFSCETDGDFVLSLLFAGAQPISVIRDQALRLSEALVEVPELEEIEAEPEIEAPVVDDRAEPDNQAEATPADEIAEAVPPETVEPVADVPREPLTFLWMLRDASMVIPEGIAREIGQALIQQLRQSQWQVEQLIIDEDYVALYALVPGERLGGQKEIRELLGMSAELMQQYDPSLDRALLWDDSYLVLAPGRELNTEDIQHFIRFVRG